ncbi:MAG: hypothetical protein ACKN9S_12060, partial [Pirellula sp.]
LFTGRPIEGTTKTKIKFSELFDNLNSSMFGPGSERPAESGFERCQITMNMSVQIASISLENLVEKFLAVSRDFYAFLIRLNL